MPFSRTWLPSADKVIISACLMKLKWKITLAVVAVLVLIAYAIGTFSILGRMFKMNN